MEIGDSGAATETLHLTRALSAALGADGAGLAAGDCLGHYILDSRLGEGGMGTVWLADQIEPVRRQVAIKLSRRRRLSGQELSLFTLEREALARMNHPAVGQIYEAGALDDGTPYFVMEYIRGDTLANYCARQPLTVAERVELMRRICLGVAHAHQRGLLHCDLKPSNILVTEVDGHPQPKIIDFGTARRLEKNQDSPVLYATLAYIAPEQAEPSASLDTRTDVYTLGLILFEILSGERLRKDLPSEKDLSLDSLRAAVARPVAPVLPSTLDFGRMARGRRRELQAIVNRCVQTEPDARYSGAEALASDLGAWLAMEPVKALPDTPAYRWQCTLRRHRLAFSIAGVALLSLVAGLAGTIAGLVEARAQRAVAEQRQSELEQVVQFQQRMLGELDMPAFSQSWISGLYAQWPEEDPLTEALRDRIARTPLVDVARQALDVQMLEPAGRVIEQDFADNPRIQSLLRSSLGRTLVDFALFERAEAELNLALTGLGAVSPDAPIASFEAELVLAYLDWELDRYGQGLARMNRWFAAARGRIAPSDPLFLEAQLYHGLLLKESGAREPAMPELRAAAEGFAQLGMMDLAIKAESSLAATVLVHQGFCPADIRARLEQLTSEQGSRALSTESRLQIHRNLSLCEFARAAYARAHDHLQASLELARTIQGNHAPGTLMLETTMLLNAMAYGQLERLVDGFESVIERADQVSGVNTLVGALPRIFLAESLSRIGRHEEALDLIESAVNRLDNDWAFLAPLEHMVHSYRGMVMTRAGQVDAGFRQLQDAISLCAERMGSEDYIDCFLLHYFMIRARFANGLDQPSPAEYAELATRAYSIFVESNPFRHIMAWYWFQSLLEAGMEGEAEQVLNDYLLAVDGLDPDDYGYEERPVLIEVQRYLAQRAAMGQRP